MRIFLNISNSATSLESLVCFDARRMNILFTVEKNFLLAILRTVLVLFIMIKFYWFLSYLTNPTVIKCGRSREHGSIGFPKFDCMSSGPCFGNLRSVLHAHEAMEMNTREQSPVDGARFTSGFLNCGGGRSAALTRRIHLVIKRPFPAGYFTRTDLG